MAVGQNPVPLVKIKIGGTWVFICPKMEAYGGIGYDPWPHTAQGAWGMGYMCGHSPSREELPLETVKSVNPSFTSPKHGKPQTAKAVSHG